MNGSEQSSYSTFDEPKKSGVAGTELSSSDSSVSVQGKRDESVKQESQMTRAKMMNTFIICLCSLINFMDRYALPGELISDGIPFRLQFGIESTIFLNYFVRNFTCYPRRATSFQLTRWPTTVSFHCQLRCGRSTSRLPRRPILQKVSHSIFCLSWSIITLLFLCQRLILIVGLSVWSLVSLAGSYMTTYEWLLALRCLGGKFVCYFCQTEIHIDWNLYANFEELDFNIFLIFEINRNWGSDLFRYRTGYDCRHVYWRHSFQYAGNLLFYDVGRWVSWPIDKFLTISDLNYLIQWFGIYHWIGRCSRYWFVELGFTSHSHLVPDFSFPNHLLHERTCTRWKWRLSTSQYFMEKGYRLHHEKVNDYFQPPKMFQLIPTFKIFAVGVLCTLLALQSPWFLL